MLAYTKWIFLGTGAVSFPWRRTTADFSWCFSDVMFLIIRLDTNWNRLVALTRNFLLFGKFGMDLDAWKG